MQVIPKCRSDRLSNLEILYQSMGNYTAAEPLLRQALEIRRVALGENHPDFATSLNNLAGLYHAMGNYAGPVPAVAHLHGGEVPPNLDGGPDAWFTSDGAYRGGAYYSFAGAAGNVAIYRYPNTQEASNIWFHDHALGITG